MSAAIDHGYLPSGRYIINHDIMNCTAEGVVGNHLYCGRALGLSEPWDMIQLHPDLQPLWDDVSAHYDRIGLRHAKKVVWHVHRAELGEHIGYHPSVCSFLDRTNAVIGETINGWRPVDFINSKNNFMELADELGIDVPQTICFDSPAQVGADALQKVSYPCYAKAAVSVSGVGIYRCEDEAELLQALQRFDDDVPIQLQEEVVTETFLNLQYRVIGKDVVRLAASEQVLEGFVHQGNRVPRQLRAMEKCRCHGELVAGPRHERNIRFRRGGGTDGPGPAFPGYRVQPPVQWRILPDSDRAETGYPRMERDHDAHPPQDVGGY